MPNNMAGMFRFSLFGIPVGVHFSFLLTAFIIGSQGGRTELSVYAETAAVLVALFVAVLLHEAGHAFTARRFGAEQVSVTLFVMGGVTTYGNDPPLSPGRRFLITAAGSGVGIFAGGIVLLAWRAGIFDEASTLLRFSCHWFIFASLGWGLLNWVPIRPLDGGQMLTAGLEMITPSRAEPIARAVTVVVGGAVIAAAFAFGEPILALFVVFLVVVGARRQSSPGDSKPPAGSSSDFPQREAPQELSASLPDPDDHQEFPI